EFPRAAHHRKYATSIIISDDVPVRWFSCKLEPTFGLTASSGSSILCCALKTTPFTRDRYMKSTFLALALLMVNMTTSGQTENRPRAREIGIKVGVLPPGAQDAITDVGGVRVGETTLIKGDSVRTGVTAILPHG